MHVDDVDVAISSHTVVVKLTKFTEARGVPAVFIYTIYV
jgi:hypothetical protein